MASIANDGIVAGSIDWRQIDLYRFFARLLAPPTHECFNFLSQPSAPLTLHDLWNYLDCDGEFPGFDWFASYELYESAYIAVFDVGVPEPPVPLFESAHVKSHSAQEIVLENTYFYEVFGLKADSSRATPDYLVTQLEFLAALRYIEENRPQEAKVSMFEAERDFIARHVLNWIPTAKTKLERRGAPQFSVLLTLLVRFLSMRQTRTCRDPIIDNIRPAQTE